MYPNDLILQHGQLRARSRGVVSGWTAYFNLGPVVNTIVATLAKHTDGTRFYGTVTLYCGDTQSGIILGNESFDDKDAGLQWLEQRKKLSTVPAQNLGAYLGDR